MIASLSAIQLLVVLASLVLAVAARFYRLRQQGHRYYDEGLYYVRALYQLELLGFVRNNWRRLIDGEETLKGIFKRLDAGWYPRNANYQLHEWMIALVFALFGRKRWASLAVSAVFGLGFALSVSVMAWHLGGKPAFLVATVLVAVDAVAVYYSRTAFGDSMAGLFLLLTFSGVLLALQGSAWPGLFLAGLAAGFCLMSKTQFYFIVLGLELCLAIGLLSTGFGALIAGMILFNLGIGLPILLIEGFYRLLKSWGYDRPTYLEMVWYQYFTITKDGDKVEQQSSYRTEDEQHRWRWLQMFWGVCGPWTCLLLGLSILGALFAGPGPGWLLLLCAAIPILNWLRHEFCALRYLFANWALLLLVIALFLPGRGMLESDLVLVLFTLVTWTQAFFLLPRYLQQSGTEQALNWLDGRATHLYAANYYNPQKILPRDHLRYAPNSLEEMEALLDEGYRYWWVDLHASYALHDPQEEVLVAVQKRIAPCREFVDEGVSQKHFWWEYCYSKIVTPKYERCFRESPTAYRTIKIYDLGDYFASDAGETQ